MNAESPPRCGQKWISRDNPCGDNDSTAPGVNISKYGAVTSGDKTIAMDET